MAGLSITASTAHRLAPGRTRISYLDLAHEGCALDGIVDDTAPFAAAVLKAQILGMELTWRGDLRVTNGLSQSGQVGGRPLRLRGDGPYTSRIINDIPVGASVQPVLDLGGFGSLLVSSQALTADALVGTRTLTMADTSAFVVGDTLLLGSTTIWGFGTANVPKGELVRVGSKTGTTITTTTPLDDSYTTVATATVRKVLVTPDALLDGFSIIDSRPFEGANSAQIRLAGHRDLTVRDVVIRNASAMGLMLEYCEDWTVDHAHFYDFTDDPANSRYGYGIFAYAATRSGSVLNSFMRGGRHMFTTGSDSSKNGVPRHIEVGHCRATAMSNACFDSHFESEFIHHHNCHVSDTVTFGFQVRAPNSTLSDCSVTRCGGPGAFLRAPRIKVRGLAIEDVRDVTFDPEGLGASLWQGQGVRVSSDVGSHQADDVRLEHVEVRDTDQDSIYCLAAALRMRGVDVKGPGRVTNANGLRLALASSTGHLIDGFAVENASVGIQTAAGVTGRLHGYRTKSVTTPGTITADAGWTVVADV